MNQVSQLEPQSLWENFSNLNAVPRPSKKEERVIAFMMDFGKSLGLETIKDHIGNVIIKKPASPGMENRQTVVMQSHLDMVHQKNNDTDFDFNSQGIQMYIDNDWVRAKGTTLGADNGIGVATIMAILASNNIDHPAIEALFTIDEETGMTGALELKGGLLSGSIMLNLDTEDDRELTIGCAGGVDITATGNYETIECNGSATNLKLTVKGLTGGHSGMDIHLGRGNANKLMNRILYHTHKKYEFAIVKVDGGGLRNAIPRESVAVICCDGTSSANIQNYILELSKAIVDEYKTTDSNLEILVEEVIVENCNTVPQSVQKKFLESIYACPNGIYRMSPDIDGLVQTSNNLARVLIENGRYEILCLTRSSVETEKDDLAHAIEASFHLLGSEVNFSGSYPGWQPKPDAAIVKLMADKYESLFNEKPHVNACHAGLECGILGVNYPEMDMISFGPNIRGAHSPDECVQISSVQKYWSFLLEVLKDIPETRTTAQ